MGKSQQAVPQSQKISMNLGNLHLVKNSGETVHEYKENPSTVTENFYSIICNVWKPVAATGMFVGLQDFVRFKNLLGS